MFIRIAKEKNFQIWERHFEIFKYDVATNFNRVMSEGL